MVIMQPRYDVAISFLSKDEPIAAAFRDRLTEGGLEVFFFPRNQEELAGTDGMESMRTPFFEGSRVAVVLFREPWGKTPWTRVEQTAIEEGCLNGGWHRLFFVLLDKTNATPLWLPQNHVRFNYTDFPLEQAVGAIKARVQESGGVIAPITPLKRADLLEQESLYIADRQQMDSEEGRTLIAQKISELFTEVETHCAEINQNINWIRVGYERWQFRAATRSCVLTDNSVSLILLWEQPIINGLKGCSLKLSEYNRRMQLPGEASLRLLTQPKRLRETIFLPELSRGREYGWIQRDNPSQFLSSSTLADKCVIQFLDLVSRDRRGEVNHPTWGV
jgi:hypothetical protein